MPVWLVLLPCSLPTYFAHILCPPGLGFALLSSCWLKFCHCCLSFAVAARDSPPRLVLCPPGSCFALTACAFPSWLVLCHCGSCFALMLCPHCLGFALGACGSRLLLAASLGYTVMALLTWWLVLGHHGLRFALTACALPLCFTHAAWALPLQLVVCACASPSAWAMPLWLVLRHRSSCFVVTARASPS